MGHMSIDYQDREKQPPRERLEGEHSL
jgi:hypothetical protein